VNELDTLKSNIEELAAQDEKKSKEKRLQKFEKLLQMSIYRR
jgi:hypothetical protein